MARIYSLPFPFRILQRRPFVYLHGSTWEYYQLYQLVTKVWW